MPNLAPETAARLFIVVGNNPSLAFVNTRLPSDDGSLRELLDSPAALAEWAAACGLFDELAMRRLRAAWSSAKAGSNALEAAHGLRAELQKILQRLLAGKTYAELAAITL